MSGREDLAGLMARLRGVKHHRGFNPPEPDKLCQDAADAIEAMAAERKAAVAVALEAAIEAAESAPTPDVPDEYRQTIAICDAIRALIPYDARAALDRIKAEAKAEGMREAAKLCEHTAYSGKWPLDDVIELGCLRCRDAILAAIPKAQR